MAYGLKKVLSEAIQKWLETHPDGASKRLQQDLHTLNEKGNAWNIVAKYEVAPDAVVTDHAIDLLVQRVQYGMEKMAEHGEDQPHG